MKAITFKANDVTYSEAIGGEIVQVCFDEDSDQDPFERNKCYLLISQNYEFGHDEPTLEWHDGKNANGGSRISSYTLEERIFELETNDGVLFRIQHNCKMEVLIRMGAFLETEYRNLKQI